MENNRLKKIATIALAITITVIATSFSISIKKNMEDLKNKDLKISVLIDEVGKLKESSNYMYGKVTDTSQEISQINNKIESSIEKSFINWENIKKDLNSTNSKLAAALNEKEKNITALALKNQELQRELDVKKHDPRILDILIIGHNKKLTDTIIIASINPITQKTSLISIPRDFYHNGRKINELYSKYGVGELQRVLEEITGIYPEKYIIFSLQSFKDLIDALGGIEINVTKQLIDNAYPGPNNTYRIIKFNAGLQKMDGNKALKYARSRKSTSDFDRAERQHQVISAVKERIKALNMLARLDLATKIYAKLQNNIETNINLFEGLSYLQHYQGYKIKSGNVISTQNLLYSTKNSLGQYILLPKAKTYADIKEYVSEIVNS